MPLPTTTGEATPDSLGDVPGTDGRRRIYGRCDMAETMIAWRGNLGPCALSPMVARDSRYEKPASARPSRKLCSYTYRVPAGWSLGTTASPSAPSVTSEGDER